MSAVVTVKCPGGTLEGLAKLIGQRTQELKGETTEKAVRATAINVLKSLRADTATAAVKPTVIDNRWKIEVSDTSYKSGWARPPRSAPNGRRVIRNGSTVLDVGPNGNRVVNLAGKYGGKLYELSLKVYSLKITELPGKSPFYDSLVIAQSKDGIFKFAQKRITRRIGQYRGISKRLLSIAMAKVHISQNGASAGDDIGRLAANYASVTTSGSGTADGTFNLAFVDNLPYSVAALKSGPSGVSRAMKKAANATAGYINRVTNRLDVSKKIEIPYPELTGK